MNPRGCMNVNRVGSIFHLLPDFISLNGFVFDHNYLSGFTLILVDGGHDIANPIRVKGEKSQQGREGDYPDSFHNFFFPIKVKSLWLVFTSKNEKGHAIKGSSCVFTPHTNSYIVHVPKIENCYTRTKVASPKFNKPFCTSPALWSLNYFFMVA